MALSCARGVFRPPPPNSHNNIRTYWTRIGLCGWACRRATTEGLRPGQRLEGEACGARGWLPWPVGENRLRRMLPKAWFLGCDGWDWRATRTGRPSCRFSVERAAEVAGVA